MSEVSLLIKAVDEATAVLKSVKGELGGLDEAGKKAGGPAGGLNNFNIKMAAMGKAVTSTGIQMSAMVTAPLAALATGVFAAATNLGNLADGLLDLREQTGLNTDSLQAYRLAAIEAGVAQDTIANSAILLQTKLTGAGEQSKAMSESLAAIGVSAVTTDGQLKGMDDLLPDIISSLQGVENITERNTLAFDIFGRGAKDLLPVLGLGAGALERLTEEADAMGMIMSEDALNSANDFRIAQGKLKAEFTAVTNSLTLEFMPMLISVAQYVKVNMVPQFVAFAEKVKSVGEWFGSLPQPVSTAILGFAGLLAALGPVLIVVGQITVAITTLTPLLPAIGAAFTALTGPIGLVVAAVGLVVTAFATDFMGVRTKTMPLIEGAIDTTFNAITNAIGMGQTAVGGFSEEFEIFWDGLKRIWSTGLQPLLIALGPLFKANFEIAKIALSTLWEVANGVVEGIVLLLEGDLKGAATAFFNVGKDLIQGLLNGIGAMFEGVKQTITNLGNNVIGWFKSAVQSQSPSKKMIQEGKNLLEGLLEGLQDPALRAEIQAEINLLGTQLFALNMAASGGLSPVGMTPSRPNIGGSNASPDGVSGGYVPSLAGGLTNPPPLGSPSAMLPSLPVLDVALADMTESVESLTTVVTSLSKTPELASPSAMLPSIPKLNTSLESMGFELDENELSLIGVKEAQRNLTNASIASSDAVLLGSSIQKDYNEATKEVTLVIPELVLSVKSAVEIFEEEQQKRRDMIEGLTTLSASDGPISMVGKGLLNLAIEQIPYFASAIQGFVEGGPIGALTAVFTELFSQSKAFSELIRIVNVLMQPFIQIFDVLTPVITGFALVLAAVYNALVVLANVVTFGAAHLLGLRQINMRELLGIDNIEGGKNSTPDAPTLPEVTAPISTSSPSISRPEFDIGRLPTAVQFAVFTPLVETLDKLSIVVERLVDEGIKVQLQSNSSSATQRFRAA